MNTDNTIFYSTSNDSYIDYATASLLSIRKYLPDAKLCLLVTHISKHHKRMLHRKHIHYKEVDLRYMFYKTWQYPVECYYLFAGPEIFLEDGYDYSVYIDGDILCCDNPLLRESPSYIAATNAMRIKDVFLGDWPQISREFKIDTNLGEELRFHSGVVYFNNKAMAKLRFLEKASNLYDRCVRANLPRKGDDSLMTLLIAKYLKDDVLLLPSTYNYMTELKYNKWQYPIKKLVFFHFITDKPWKHNPYKHDDQRLDIYNEYVRQWRTFLLKISKIAVLNSYADMIYLKKVFGRIVRLSSDFIYYLRGLKLSLIKRRRNNRQASIKLWWWKYSDGKNEIENFGDVVTRDIIRAIYGYGVVFSEMYQCQMVGVGSIMEAALRYSGDNIVNIWGSGYLDDKNHNWKNNLYVYSCRGTMTSRRIPQYAFNNKQLTLGDPGILANVVYPKCRATSKIGIVVHHTDLSSNLLRDLSKDSRFKIINPLCSPEVVAQQISSCRLILSSSLHGMIFADSYKIPNYHIILSNKVEGGEYKFRDYCSGVEREYQKADVSKVFDNDYLQRLINGYKPIKHLARRQRMIVRSFPYY